MGSGSSSTKTTVNSRKTTTVTVTTETTDVPHFKIVLIGDPGVGKSSIFFRYVKNQFFHQYLPTQRCVIENVVRKVNLPQNAVASVTLWDLPGREDMDIRDSYYRNVDAAIVVVDMDNPANIAMAPTLRQGFMNKSSAVKLVTNGGSPDGIHVPTYEELPYDPKTVPFLLLGNKYDLVEEKLVNDKLWMMPKDEEGDEKPKQEPGDKDDLDLEMQALEKELNINDLAADEKEDTMDSKDDDRWYFEPIRGPKKGQRKPECVQLLEQTESEHKFVGSMIVSAKDNDSSVHLAIQSLVRHLIEKRQPRLKKKKMTKKEKKKKKVIKEDNPDLLELLEIKQFDQVSNRCNMAIRRTKLYIDLYEVGLKKFKQACADSLLIFNNKASLEDCITAIKDAFKKPSDLKLEPDEGFLKFTVDETEVKVTRDIKVSLQSYHNEYAVVCKAILRDFPVLSNILDKLDDKISYRCDHLDEVAPEVARDKEQRKYVIDMCEKNRAKVAHLKGRLQEYLNIVNGAVEKIKAALIW